MYYRGPSRLLWFGLGAFAAVWYHRAHARGEFRGWGPCGNRRIEEWRAEKAAKTATKEQFPAHTTSRQEMKETVGEWSWRPAAPPSLQDEEVHRMWEEKTKKAQETVADLSESALDGILVAAESLKARLAEFRQSQKQEQEGRAPPPPPEEPKPRHYV